MEGKWFFLCFFLNEYGKKQVKEMCKQIPSHALALSPRVLHVCAYTHVYELYGCLCSLTEIHVVLLQPTL